MEELELLKSQGFQVLRPLGQGAYANVFLVNHQQLGEMAAKVMKNEDFNEKEWEAAGIFDKDPPNSRPFIVRNIRAKQFDKMTVLLIDYANLGSLYDLMQTDQNLPTQYVRAIMNQILVGLRYIHSRGLIHRDIKGGNILLHNPIGSGRVILKIADFGVAKTKTGNGVNIQVTVIGTEPYMAPEFILGDGQEKVIADAK
ncbi:MAG: hypothetical protein EZS28_037335, partial [Streblomastix strix]